jgi:hypothetical protein
MIGKAPTVEPVPSPGVHVIEEPAMTEDQSPLPDQEDADFAKEGEKNRREIEEVPEPGTDPLHEGP